MAKDADVDVVVVGAGMAGLYMLYKLRTLGLSARAFETADGVGGTWYWNRYPGARCDVQSIDYSYSFDPELENEWTWSEKYATQPEILRYLNYVADKHDLERDIQFSTKVESAIWNDGDATWEIVTDDGATTSCRFYVMATGCLSLPKTPDIAGLDDFDGDVYFTSSWPHDGVDLTGKRVGVIGTGSSGIQSIPIMAAQAAELTVFQRTANFSLPAHNGPIPRSKLEMIDGRHAEYREEARWSRGGVPGPESTTRALSVSADERQEIYEKAWEAGELFAILRSFADLGVNQAANDTCADFLRGKIHDIVDDPATAELLAPTGHAFGTKRPCLDSGYFETFNQPHVHLVDLRSDPIDTITNSGIRTAENQYDFDVIVLATGFDAMTGAIVAVDITGRNGVSLREKWVDGPRNYLGLSVVDFPNFFTITGPGSPSVLSNMAVSIEQHVEWICRAINDVRANGFDTIEATQEAQDGWGVHVNDCAAITLFPQADSWYMGANVPGKPRVFLPYVGGVDAYRHACNEVAEQGYLGFRLTGGDKQQQNDGVIRRLQPDVKMVLDVMAGLDLPPLESLSPQGARDFSVEASAQRPPGPDVGEIVDGVFDGADGELAFRLYRPDTPGPHPVVIYFHGGGWVLGSEQSDDPLCRDLCVRSDAIVWSANYRHAPEARFPAAAEDAWAAVQWMAENCAELGGDPNRLAVAGWSAGGNLAAVVAQRARDNGGPTLSGQVLLTPVTDSDMSRPSYAENAEGYVLSTALMEWFWDHYVDPEDRADPRVAPLRASDLSGLPPAFIVTAEFDPLRDEGAAYAEALTAAGVDATHVQARGHTHTSVAAVDVVISGREFREQMARAVHSFLSAPLAVAD